MVKGRAKPEDYVYTDVEVERWVELEERIDQIEENGVSDEKIAEAVTEYLTENPVESPVESVNGKTGAVTLTAEDVGALPADTEIPSTAGLATEKYVDDAVAGIEIPEVDLTDYATKNYVAQEIAKIEPEDVDLSNYYTKNQTDSKISSALTPYAKLSVLSNVAISGDYADLKNKPTIPTVPTKVSAFTNDAGYATEDYVGQKIGEAQLGGEVDLSNYYTKAQTDKAIEDAVKDIDIPESDMSAYAKTADLATVATSGSYNDLIDLPSGSISVGSEPDGDAQIWIDTSGGDAIDFADVAFTGSYTNLINTPDLSVYQTAAQVKAIIDAELGVIENGTY